MAALTPMLKTMLTSPQARALAKTGGKWVAQKALTGIQKRRVRKGRSLMFPAQPGVRTSTSTTIPPVRQNVQKSNQGLDGHLTDTEACTLAMKGGTDANGTLVYVPLDPMALSIWPKVTKKAQLYTCYSVKSLTFEYVPQVGSAYNGQIAVAFTPQANTDSATFSTPEEILALPCSTSFAASSRAIFSIPLKDMSKNGQNLYINNGIGDVTVDNTLYYMGTLAFRIYACSDATTAVGLWRVRYDLILSRPRLDTSTPNSVWTLTYQRPGLFQLIVDGTIAQITTNCEARWFILYNGLTSINFLINEISQTPVLSVPGVSKTLYIYETRRLTMRDSIEIVEMGDVASIIVEPCTRGLIATYVLPDTEVTVTTTTTSTKVLTSFVKR